MSNKIVYLGLAIFIVAFWGTVFYVAWRFADNVVRRIDCSLAEISPDFTPEMRKECRERRSHKL
jgi:hypothetical protein